MEQAGIDELLRFLSEDEPRNIGVANFLRTAELLDALLNGSRTDSRKDVEMAPDDEIDFDSTLVRRGRDAGTFDQVSAFAKEIEGRPLDKLLLELPGLAALSEWKFRLASQMFGRRYRQHASVEKQQLRIFAEEVAANESGEVASKIRELIAERT